MLKKTAAKRLKDMNNKEIKVGEDTPMFKGLKKRQKMMERYASKLSQ